MCLYGIEKKVVSFIYLGNKVFRACASFFKRALVKNCHYTCNQGDSMCKVVKGLHFSAIIEFPEILQILQEKIIFPFKITLKFLQLLIFPSFTGI